MTMNLAEPRPTLRLRLLQTRFEDKSCLKKPSHLVWKDYQRMTQVPQVRLAPNPLIIIIFAIFVLTSATCINSSTALSTFNSVRRYTT